MKISLCLFFIISFMFLLSFLIGCIFVYNKNSSIKLKSAYSVFLAFCMTVYLISALALGLNAIYLKEINYIPYFVFALFPFIIGYFSSYKKLKFYTFLQILIILSGCIQSFITLINYWERFLFTSAIKSFA